MITQTVGSRGAYSSSGSEATSQLRKKLQSLGNIPSLTNEVRNQLSHMLLRIDLETATPSAQDPITELGRFIVESIRALRNNHTLPPAVDEDLRKIALLVQGTESTSESLVILCQLCGQTHDLERTDFSFDRPDLHDYLFPSFMFRRDVAGRTQCAKEFMAIDMRRFFIRGDLRIRMQMTDKHIDMSVWVEVEQAHFSNYVERLLRALDGKPVNDHPSMIRGRLANRLNCYPETFNQPVEIDCSSRFDAASIAIRFLDCELQKKLDTGLSAQAASLMFSRGAHETARQQGQMHYAAELDAGAQTGTAA
jgi:hypothetical protein